MGLKICFNYLLIQQMSTLFALFFAVPGPALETFVGDDINTILILNLFSGTEYSVKVFASYSTGFSDALTGVAKTCKNDFMLFRSLRAGFCCNYGFVQLSV